MQREEQAVQLVSNWVKDEQSKYGGQSDSVALHWKLAMYVYCLFSRFNSDITLSACSMSRSLFPALPLLIRWDWNSMASWICGAFWPATYGWMALTKSTPSWAEQDQISSLERTTGETVARAYELFSFSSFFRLP